MTEAPPIDPLADAIGRGGVPRDRWDRALLVPKAGGARVPYTAASTLADYITNDRAIRIWRERYLARGMGMREDLAQLAAAETYSTAFGEQDQGDNRASGRRLDEIIERAQDSAGMMRQADHGTAVHLLTEPGQLERGAVVPTVLRPDVDAFWRAVRGVRIVATELFVANDHLGSAGTFDHLFAGEGYLAEEIHRVTGVDVTGTLIVVDKKTGRLEKPKAAIQMAVYCGGELYDTETDGRTTFEERFGMPANQDVGIFFHVSARQGTATMIPLDLVDGREAAEHAAWVREWRKRSQKSKDTLDADRLARLRLTDIINRATNVAELNVAWSQFEDVWTEMHTELAQVLIAEKGLV